MKYILILAEKPQVAKKIAAFLSTGGRPKAVPVKHGKDQAYYYIVNRPNEMVFVAPAVGHIYEVDTKTKGYDYPVFDVEWMGKYEKTDARGNPIKTFSYTKVYEKMIQIAAARLANLAKKGATDPSQNGELKKAPTKKTVHDLIMSSPIEIYVATDYDREGETIGYTVLKYALGLNDDEIQQKAKRMKFSAITKGDILHAYQNPMPTINFGFARAGETRHELDWYWGINLTRALTNSTKRAKTFAVISTGRVQGPTLKILVDREREIKNFKPKPYWTITAIAEKDGVEFKAKHEKDKFWDESEAKKVLQKIKGKPLTVKNVTVKKEKKLPPTPFDLTTLQKEAYRVYGYSPKKTLDIAQKLYEAGYLSYPRTESQKLPKKNWQNIISKLSNYPDFSQEAQMVLSQPELKPHEGKKDDPAHKAIHPTGEIPSQLSPDEYNIYVLVGRRFLASFYEPAEVLSVKVEFEVEGEKFITSGKRITKRGWYDIYPYSVPNTEILPQLNRGDKITKVKYTIKKDMTKPPQRYSPASLISKMESLELGTKATRGDIIETLYKRGYIKGKKSIEVTDLGMKVVEVLEQYSPKILSVELTSEFEKKLSEIENGREEKEKVISEAIEELTKILEDIKKNEDKIGQGLKPVIQSSPRRNYKTKKKTYSRRGGGKK